MHFVKTIVTLLVVVAFAGSAAAQLPAFPGAEGAGGYAAGGRGGDVYHVTNLLDSGPGSLRFGIENAAGPRTVVFDVGGQIDLESYLSIEKPSLTIAGQTAPGGGITLAGYHLQIVNARDVVVRYLRVRPGDIHTAPDVYEPDALSVVTCENVILDHVSASWSTDEVLSTTHESNHVTVQWSMITEALHHSNHSKDNHGYGSLVNGGDFTFHHNLYAHNRSRNPRPSRTAGVVRLTRLDFVNNVVYNPGDRFGYGGDDEMDLNFTGNYGISGPNTTYNRLFYSPSAATRIYQDGNYMDTDRDGALDGTNAGWGAFSGGFTQVGARFDLPPIATQSAPDALASVLAGAGASLYRDAVDRRVVENVLSYGLTGDHLDSQSEVGGWPTLPGGAARGDADQDGMPDAYERGIAHLNPSNTSDGNLDGNGNGYTNLEDYLHFLTTPRWVNRAVTVPVQADAGITELSPDAASASLYVRHRYGATDRHEVAVLRFDVSSLASIDNMTLNLTSMGDDSAKSLYFYGLREADSLVDGLPWNEAALTYSNTPGVFPDGLLYDNEAAGTLLQKLDMVEPTDPGDDSTALATFLGSMTTAYATNATISFSDARLVEFLSAAIAGGDETITIIVQGAPGSSSPLVQFYGKEAMIDDGQGGQAPIPEAWRPNLLVETTVPRFPGDADRNGVVDEADARILAGNWGTDVWQGADDGDFNGDGSVDASDAAILAANWGQGWGEAASVPEPGTIALWLSVLTTLMAARRLWK